MNKFHIKGAQLICNFDIFNKKKKKKKNLHYPHQTDRVFFLPNKSISSYNANL